MNTPRVRFDREKLVAYTCRTWGDNEEQGQEQEQEREQEQEHDLVLRIELAIQRLPSNRAAKSAKMSALRNLRIVPDLRS